MRTVVYSQFNRTLIIGTVGRVTNITFSPTERIKRVVMGARQRPDRGAGPEAARAFAAPEQPVPARGEAGLGRYVGDHARCRMAANGPISSWSGSMRRRRMAATRLTRSTASFSPIRGRKRPPPNNRPPQHGSPGMKPNKNGRRRRGLRPTSFMACGTGSTWPRDRPRSRRPMRSPTTAG